MSAFTMTETGFAQLANELASHVWNKHSKFNWSIRNFLDLEYNCTLEEIEKAGSLEAKLLQIANHIAVNQRYNENNYPEPQEIKATATYPRWSNIQLLKHLQCLRYQMSEGNVPDGDTYKKLTKLIGSMCEALVSDMPEYDRADWGW